MIQNDTSTICLYAKTYSKCATNCRKMPLQHGTQCSDKRIQDSNWDCTPGMRTANDTCKVSCTLQILSSFLILYHILLILWECILQKAIEAFPLCVKLRQYKHGKKAQRSRCGTWETREVEPPNIDLHWKYGETLAPHCTYSPRSRRKVVSKVETKGSLVHCGAILWPLRSATMQQVHLVAGCFVKPRT